MVGPIIDAGYEIISITMKVFDSHACPPAPTAVENCFKDIGMNSDR